MRQLVSEREGVRGRPKEGREGGEREVHFLTNLEKEMKKEEEKRRKERGKPPLLLKTESGLSGGEGERGRGGEKKEKIQGE